VPGITLHGPADVASASFTLDYAHPHDIAEILGREDICVRAGHHCAQVLMDVLGVHATARASVALHTTREDVDRLIDGIGRVHAIFG
jgi:cysteine desulfurase/selenocysteine lyase